MDSRKGSGFFRENAVYGKLRAPSLHRPGTYADREHAVVWSEEVSPFSGIRSHYGQAQLAGAEPDHQGDDGMGYPPAGLDGTRPLGGIMGGGGGWFERAVMKEAKKFRDERTDG